MAMAQESMDETMDMAATQEGSPWAAANYSAQSSGTIQFEMRNATKLCMTSGNTQEPEQTEIVQLKVHGGGGLTATMVPEGLGLDSHVLDGTVRARLSPEERLAREVARRRQLELERRQRIFNSKRRLIGIDKQVIDAQVAEQQLRKEEQKRLDIAEDRAMLALDKQLKLQEAAKKQTIFELEKDCREFSSQQLSKEKSDTFDLNDPLRLRKEAQMRYGDADPRCGAASMLKFGGEDLMKAERKRQQQKQQVMFIEQQQFEKEMLIEENSDKKYIQETAEMIALRNEMETNEQNLRKELQQSQQAVNLDHAAGRARQQQELKEQESLLDAAELYHHGHDPFLNECKDNTNPNGRVRRAEYKGATKEERMQGLRILRQQAAEQNMQKYNEKVEDFRFQNLQEAARRQLILQERDKARNRRAMAEAMAKENLQLKAEKVQQTKAMNELYTNKFSDDFFAQFGTTTR
ncbi:unnamed protein product [Effrenium voratum]|uniref:RIB43A-like with coiled-coils protein 2 n=1 Tax=Effrenium voratum TaxID=2562239 RepID=A0AA36IKP5_9DINO|nr:unnamed protein product [Effrenium voratum]